jgi:hypothetical protein
MGSYSRNISKKLAKSLVTPKDKKHAIFSKYADPDNEFWMSKGDPNFLHFGRGHLEGELKLSSKGKSYHKSYKNWS